MNTSNTVHTRMAPLPLALMGSLCGALALSLTACGGGGSSSPTASGGTVSGVVLDGPIQGATVCLDLNANLQCDSGEPASAPTDAQGRYTIAGLTADQQNSGKEWIAVVPAGATDGGTPFTQPFVLRAPASKPEVISPFTHMVQVAMGQGAGSQGAAESLVASQLGLNDAASLYANYSSGNPSADSGTLAALAPTIVGILQSGAQPTVVASGNSTPSTGAYNVRNLNYTDPMNYTLRIFYRGADDATGYLFYDVRGGMSGGAAMTSDALYGTTRRLTAAGWISNGPAVANHSTFGAPFYSESAGYRAATLSMETDLSGRPLSDAVNLANDLSSNTDPTLTGVNASALTGTLPKGATVRRYQVTMLATPVLYSPDPGNSVTQSYPGQNITTVNALIATFPISTTYSGATSVSMGDLHPSSHACASGQTSCVFPAERLRVMFGANNAAQYVLCDLNWPANTASNCQPKNTGTYNKTMGIDGVTPIVQFAGLPPEADVKTTTRVFVEKDGEVWYGSQDKLTNATQTRLNDIAFVPIAAQLGITVPANPN
ncbi:MAG: carboxypeptidase regulatory-like domain-containing protein [Betaproteobacteria bacterium]|nr:carboxypeptidase regulatory-like domain-containing protein [Betaproteobacteria bacterium]MDE2122706.1 carboxypeptidase regulatory-like domain-containing protein [Betaproteobacteria bacterium]MDE2186743.1 carboxypeptidase regulatory-like domain-containing protein [Betaproteobacteria bacterium]MDE2323727.1 carboxypeptidase regulatory-like domain-containing protein [Betaproteobacteria bacterium]